MSKKEIIIQKLKNTFDVNKSICLVFVAFFFTFLVFTIKETSFTSISFNQDVSWLNYGLVFLSGLIVSSLLVLIFDKLPLHSWLLSLFALTLAIYWILKAQFSGMDRTNFSFIIIIFLSIVFFYAIGQNKELINKCQNNNKISLIFMIICGITLMSVLIIYGVLRYKSYTAPNFDFGIFAQAFHNIKETGLPMVTSERDKLISHFAVHFSPIYYLMFPFYLIFESPITLQVIQAVALASGIIPLWFIAKEKKFSTTSSMLLSFIYLFSPIVTNGTFYDFHENCVLVPFLLWLFYFTEKNKFIPMLIFSVLVLMVKEDAAFYIIIVGIYLVCTPKRRLKGSILTLISLLYFIIVLLVLDKYGEGTMSESRFGNLMYNDKDGLIGVIKTILVNPGYALSQIFKSPNGAQFSKPIYFLLMTLPLGLLPLLTKKLNRLILLVPILINMLSMYTYQTDIGFQYHFGVIAFFLYASVINYEDLNHSIRDKALVLGAIASFTFYIALSLTSIGGTVAYYRDTKENSERMTELLETIPQNVSVSCSTFLLPHLAQRETIYEVYYHDVSVEVDYVVIDMRPGYDTEGITYVNLYKTKGYNVLNEYEGFITILINPEA